MQPARVCSTRARAAAWLHGLVFVAACVGLMLTKIRYAFERNDHQQYLLLPYREIVPSFLPGDWFTWETSHYHVTFSWLVRAIAVLSGEQGFALGMLLGHCAVLASFGVALWALASATGFGRFAAWFALLVTMFVRSHALGGALVNHGVLLPADAALPPFLLACAAFVARRPRATGVLLGVSGFLHANYALLGPIVLGALELSRGVCRRPGEASPRSLRFDTGAVRRCLEMAAGYLLLAWPTLWVIARSFVLPDTAPEQTALFFEVRSPHHYDISRFSLRDLLWMASVLVLAMPALAGPRHGARAARALTMAFGLLMLVGLLGAALHLLPVVRVFVWRMSVPMALVLLLATGAGIRDALLARRARLLPVYAAGLVWLVSFGGSAKLPWPERLPDALSSMARFSPVAMRPNRRSHEGRLEAWVRARTPPDARFLVPPGFIDFRLQARRAIFVDWKCTPMRGDELLEWKRRMLAAMGTRDFPVVGYRLRHASTRAYLGRPLPELAALARAEGMTHLVAGYLPRRAALTRLEPLARFGPYRVYEVLP